MVLYRVIVMFAERIGMRCMVCAVRPSELYNVTDRTSFVFFAWMCLTSINTTCAFVLSPIAYASVNNKPDMTVSATCFAVFVPVFHTQARM